MLGCRDSGLCCLQYLLALSPGWRRRESRQAKRLEIKVYLKLNQQNSDKMELLRPILRTVCTCDIILSGLHYSLRSSRKVNNDKIISTLETELWAN